MILKYSEMKYEHQSFCQFAPIFTMVCTGFSTVLATIVLPWQKPNPATEALIRQNLPLLPSDVISKAKMNQSRFQLLHWGSLQRSFRSPSWI